MNIALIKDGECKNVAVFGSPEKAIDMLQNQYDFVLACPENRGVGHRYINGIWYNPQPERDADGVIPYVPDMCVKVGDLVRGINGLIYRSTEDIDFQQYPPESLPDQYTLVSE